MQCAPKCLWSLLCFSLMLPNPNLAVAGTAGRVKKNVYYSPAGNFQVPLPKGIGMKLNDTYDKGDGVGVVSFHDDFGSLDVIHYVRVPAEFLPKLQTPESKQHLLRDWLHNFAMPHWFLPASPNGKVLREARGTFEEMPAVFALVDLPGASTMVITTAGETRRGDSRRGLVIFLKGPWLYMLAKETAGLAGLADKPAEPDDKWMSFVEREKSFYQSISFSQ